MCSFQLWRIHWPNFRAVSVAMLFVALAHPNRGDAKAGEEKRVPPSENIFTNREVLRIQIEIPEKGMATLREYNWRGWNGPQQQERPAVKGTVREGNNVYKDVAIHLKGAAGSFRPVD